MLIAIVWAVEIYLIFILCCIPDPFEGFEILGFSLWQIVGIAGLAALIIDFTTYTYWWGPEILFDGGANTWLKENCKVAHDIINPFFGVVLASIAAICGGISGIALSILGPACKLLARISEGIDGFNVIMGSLYASGV